jgi:hypothetical protein
MPTVATVVERTFMFRGDAGVMAVNRRVPEGRCLALMEAAG